VSSKRRSWWLKRRMLTNSRYVFLACLWVCLRVLFSLCACVGLSLSLCLCLSACLLVSVCLSHTHSLLFSLSLSVFLSLSHTSLLKLTHGMIRGTVGDKAQNAQKAAANQDLRSELEKLKAQLAAAKVRLVGHAAKQQRVFVAASSPSLYTNPLPRRFCAQTDDLIRQSRRTRPPRSSL